MVSMGEHGHGGEMMLDGVGGGSQDRVDSIAGCTGSRFKLEVGTLSAHVAGALCFPVHFLVQARGSGGAKEVPAVLELSHRYFPASLSGPVGEVGGGNREGAPGFFPVALVWHAHGHAFLPSLCRAGVCVVLGEDRRGAPSLDDAA